MGALHTYIHALFIHACMCVYVHRHILHCTVAWSLRRTAFLALYDYIYILPSPTLIVTHSSQLLSWALSCCFSDWQSLSLSPHCTTPLPPSLSLPGLAVLIRGTNTTLSLSLSIIFVEGYNDILSLFSSKGYYFTFSLVLIMSGRIISSRSHLSLSSSGGGGGGGGVGPVGRGGAPCYPSMPMVTTS